jgi:hypothetical protein
METRFAKLVITITLAIGFLISVCPSSFAIPRRVEECGIESFAGRADPACGVTNYISTRSPVCGIETYKEQQSLECPGSEAGGEFWSDSCPVGFSIKERRSRTGRCAPNPDRERGGGGGGSCSVNEVYCTKPSNILTCRLPQFGIDLYKECRNPSHGIENYNTCTREEFGVAQYKECEVRKTRAELTSYIQSLDPNIDVMGVALIQNTGNLLKLGGNETALACYIKRWDSDPLYKDAISELKTIQFPALFGVAYDPNNYDCSNPPPLSVSTQTCSDGTPRCKFQTAYNAAISFFETNRAEVTALLDDVLARTDSTYKTQLESLNAKMSNYNKS